MMYQLYPQKGVIIAKALSDRKFVILSLRSKKNAQ